MEAIRQNVTHHVDEERKGMFAKARAIGMELSTVARKMETRRDEIAAAVQGA
jgi:hypothetical protein